VSFNRGTSLRLMVRRLDRNEEEGDIPRPTEEASLLIHIGGVLFIQEFVTGSRGLRRPGLALALPGRKKKHRRGCVRIVPMKIHNGGSW